MEGDTVASVEEMSAEEEMNGGNTAVDEGMMEMDTTTNDGAMPTKEHGEEEEGDNNENTTDTTAVDRGGNTNTNEGPASSDQASSSQAPPLAQASPSPPKQQPQRPMLSGVLLGLFVVIDPRKQRTKFNLKRELEFLGIHQRDVSQNEEAQVSLEQAFYLLEELKRLHVYMPPNEEGEQVGPLNPLEAWQAFSSISDTFVRSVGSYRYFRNRGFVVHGGLNLGLDYMLYRGTPQRYHAEFGVFLRYPTGVEYGEETPLTFRDLHLLYRLIGEVRKTLIVGHVRLGEAPSKRSKGKEAADIAASDQAASVPEGGEEEVMTAGGDGEEEEELSPAAIEMARWYTNLTVFEVAITPWRAGTPLARLSKAAKNQNAQLKRGGGRKRGRRQSR